MNKNWHNKFFIEDITEDFKLKIHQELKEEFQKYYKTMKLYEKLEVKLNETNIIKKPKI